MIDYYREQGSLQVVDGTQSPDDVFAALTALLGVESSAGGGSL
jgi:adenylate kinase family enzyme